MNYMILILFCCSTIHIHAFRCRESNVYFIMYLPLDTWESPRADKEKLNEITRDKNKNWLLRTTTLQIYKFFQSVWDIWILYKIAYCWEILSCCVVHCCDHDFKAPF